MAIYKYIVLVVLYVVDNIKKMGGYSYVTDTKVHDGYLQVHGCYCQVLNTKVYGGYYKLLKTNI